MVYWELVFAAEVVTQAELRRAPRPPHRTAITGISSSHFPEAYGRLLFGLNQRHSFGKHRPAGSDARPATYSVPRAFFIARSRLARGDIRGQIAALVGW